MPWQRTAIERDTKQKSMAIALKTDQKCLQYLHIWPDGKSEKRLKKKIARKNRRKCWGDEWRRTTTLIDEHVQQILPPLFRAAWIFSAPNERKKKKEKKENKRVIFGWHFFTERKRVKTNDEPEFWLLSARANMLCVSLCECVCVGHFK